MLQIISVVVKSLSVLAAALLLAACVPFLSPAPTATAPVQATTVPLAATGLPAAGPSGVPNTPAVPNTGGTSIQSVPTGEAPRAVTATQAAPQCSAPAGLTPAQTEGPYFKAGSPERSNLVDNLPGARLVLTGYVLDSNCQPIPHALLDFWQADSQGQYDNAGYTLRGHQFTGENGAYRLETVVPGLYPGRTEHIHVKVQATNGPVLTTQLYFPGVSQNDADGIYNPATLIQVQSSTSDEVQATFNFIIAK